MESLSQTKKDSIRKQRIEHPKFDYTRMGDSGPINSVLSCGFTNENYRKHYEEIEWDG